MSIRARMKFEDADLEKVNVSITLTMPLEEWRKLMRDLPNNWPSWKVANLISTAIGDVARATSVIYDGTDVRE